MNDIERAIENQRKLIEKWQNRAEKLEATIEKYPWGRDGLQYDFGDWRESELKRRREQIETALIIVFALEKQLNGGWIPVSERLPNEEECNKFNWTHPNYRSFICTIVVPDYEPQVRKMFFTKKNHWEYAGEEYKEYVIAWQPLPEPYKETETKKSKKNSCLVCGELIESYETVCPPCKMMAYD